MRIAITGATGFLGRYLIRNLQDAGHQLTAWSRSTPLPTPGVDWVRGQLGNPGDAEALVASADAVVHSGLARAGASFLDSGDAPLDYWHRNATGSLQLLEAAAQAGVGSFVFVSSGAVHDRVLSDRPLDETHPLLPGTLYGACKASVETLVHHYGQSGKIHAATVRPTSIYGLAEPASDSKWYEIVRQICQGRDVDVSGGSKAVHAGDVAKAVTLLLGQLSSRADQVCGQTYNCCDRMISEFEVATIAKRLANSPSRITGAMKTAKHQIDTGKIQALGMRFGGDPLLERTIAQLVDAVQSENA
jgi:dTDP-glucose 4,6-dehydratase